MSDSHGFKLDYAEISERIEWLLGVNTRLVLVEDSPEAIEGGIYKWDEAGTAGSLAKNALIEDYMILVTRMRMDLEERNNPCQMNSFDHSCKTVLHYLKQDTYVWESSAQAVLKSVKRELTLQYCILAQSVKV